MSDEIQTTETAVAAILAPTASLAANKEALLEMAAWDCEHEIFSLEQRLF